MPDPQSHTYSFSASISAARAKLISALVIVALILGIAHEAISFLTGYYNLVKARCDAYQAVLSGSARQAVGAPPSPRLNEFLHKCID
jgi:hypothetical protein